MKTILISFFIVMLSAAGARGWYATEYDTTVIRWPDGKLKEYYTRASFLGNEKGFFPHGQYSSWYENGQLKEQGYYDWDKKYGTWIKWYPDGKRMEEIAYINNSREGEYLKWHPDGTPMLIGYYKTDLKHGLWAERREGEDINNADLYFLYVEFYYHGDLLVKLEGEHGDILHDRYVHYNKELDLWIEWNRGNSMEWLENYTTFDIGKKSDGQKVGEWVRLNTQGHIVSIFNYY